MTRQPGSDQHRRPERERGWAATGAGRSGPATGAAQPCRPERAGAAGGGAPLGAVLMRPRLPGGPASRRGDTGEQTPVDRTRLLAFYLLADLLLLSGVRDRYTEGAETRGFAWLRRRARGDRARPVGTRPCSLATRHSFTVASAAQLVPSSPPVSGMSTHCRISGRGAIGHLGGGDLPCGNRCR